MNKMRGTASAICPKNFRTPGNNRAEIATMWCIGPGEGPPTLPQRCRPSTLLLRTSDRTSSPELQTATTGLGVIRCNDAEH
jgi:hypothetical protein